MIEREELQKQLFLAVLNFRKKYYEIELEEYLAVMKYATPKMKSYDKLVKQIDAILNAIKSADKELQKSI
jgi:hypothetical protein